MHSHLVSYLQDNRDYIVENWLTGLEIPSPNDPPNVNNGTGVPPYSFFINAFDSILQSLEIGPKTTHEAHEPQLNDFIGHTCECREGCAGGRVCIELHESALKAFVSVFSDEWDSAEEFTGIDREFCLVRINHAISRYFGHEIEHCPHLNTRRDCPYTKPPTFS